MAEMRRSGGMLPVIWPGEPFVSLNNPAPGNDCDALLPIAVKPDECVRFPEGELAFSKPVG
jgi:hypothetical protein